MNSEAIHSNNELYLSITVYCLTKPNITVLIVQINEFNLTITEVILIKLLWETTQSNPTYVVRFFPPKLSIKLHFI